MSKLILFLFLILSSAFNQLSAQVAPPAMAMPSEINKALVNRILIVTDHETYFKEYCTKKVQECAAAKGTSEEKTKAVLQSIKFSDYSSTIYNSYADYSEKELRELVNVLQTINKKSNEWTKMVLTNSMMQSNLDLYVSSLLKRL